MFEKIKNLFTKFKKDNEIDILDEEVDMIKIEDMPEILPQIIDYDSYDDPILEDGNKDKVLMVVDDINDTDFLLHSDFKNMKRRFGYNPEGDVKIVKCFTDKAGFIAFKYLRDNPKIDYAILDLTFGYGIKLSNGHYKYFDGVDIALAILENNPEAKIMFLTAHTMNRDNVLLKDYIDKFENNRKENIMKYIVNKNGDRQSKIYELLFKDE